MSLRPGAPSRVLLGDLAPMIRLGLERVLSVDGAEVHDSRGGAFLPAEAERLRPDVVVLAQGGAGGTELCERVRAAAPRAKVILWSPDEDEFEVLDPGRDDPRRVVPPLPNALLGELGRTDRTIGRE